MPARPGTRRQLIFPNNYLDGIARTFPNLFAYGPKHAQRVKWITVFDKRAPMRNAIESRLYRHLPFGSEFLLGIVRKKHISSSAVPRFNFPFGFVFFLSWSSNNAATITRN